MSSIYRKGRDGYFYYQTYVYNNETNKKDKKIFHSLNTKDRSVAEEKQILLDQRYSKRKKSLFNLFYVDFNKKAKILILFPLLGFMTIIYFSFNKSKQTIYDLNYYKELPAPLEENVESMSKLEDKIELEIKISENETVQDSSNLNDTTQNYSLLPLPDHYVLRIEDMSSGFDQAKIYVIVKDSVSDRVLENLCKNIKGRYSEFSNLVICLFSNDKAGIQMANNGLSSISTKEHPKSWLAMYSSNPVEGEYFDNNPGRYLRNY